MPAISEETERAIRAFAYYFSVDEKETEFWISQWKLSKLTKSKPNNKYPNEQGNTGINNKA